MEWIAAFSLGLLGSLHCVGMCGPLMLAVAGRGREVAWYQTGRIITYSLVGALIGGLGFGVQLLHLQGVLAIASGTLLVSIACTRLSPDRWIAKWTWYNVLQVKLRARVGRWLRQYRGAAYLGLGCCNGLLPCGLVYLAVVAAANTGSIPGGALFMFAFGTGTLPALLILLVTGHRLANRVRVALLRFVPVVTAIAGVLLLYRGITTAFPGQLVQFQQLAFPPMCH